MRIRFILLCLTVLVGAGLSYGANELQESISGPDESTTLLNVNGAMLVAGGTALPGVDVGIATRVLPGNHFYFGGEIGTFVAATNPSYLLIPLLADLHYQFMPDSVVHPLLGVLLGPAIATGGGYSTLNFEWLMRPGLNFSFRTVSINLEPRFGIIGASFVFAPQLGLIFAL